MKVMLAGSTADRLSNAVKAFKDGCAGVLGVVTDVSQSVQVENLAQKALDSFG